MKSIFRNLIPLLVLGGVVYLFRDYIPFLKPSPCEEPIPYVLGTFDEKFGISEQEFLDAVAQAEKIWEESIDKELFTYQPETSSPKSVFGERALRINLVYDYRQEATEDLKELGIVVENNRDSYDMLRSKFEGLKTEYERDKKAFEAQMNSFNQRKRAYEEEVRSWNRQGGAPPAEYEKLELERRELEDEANALMQEQAKLNTQAGEINALVRAINRLARLLNLSIEEYNTVSVSRGESFEEGLYSEDGLERDIYIYEFEDRNKLVRVLAHELGHALGLDHVDNPEAIMYKLNQSENAELAPGDIASLKTRCNIKNKIH